MGWLDNLWRRRQGSTRTDVVETHAETDSEVADEIEEEAHEARDEQALEEPRPPGG